MRGEDTRSGSRTWTSPIVARTTDQAQALGGEVLLGPARGPDGFRSVVSTPDGGEVAFWQSKTER